MRLIRDGEKGERGYGVGSGGGGGEGEVCGDTWWCFMHPDPFTVTDANRSLHGKFNQQSTLKQNPRFKVLIWICFSCWRKGFEKASFFKLNSQTPGRDAIEGTKVAELRTRKIRRGK